MKKYLVVSLILVCFCDCSQNKRSDLTSDNYVETMINSIKHYSYEPKYQLEITNIWCYSEILVNDILVYNNFENSDENVMLDINNYIFKSGDQKVTFRLYPVDKYYDENSKVFVAETSMSIFVNEYDAKTKSKKIIKKYRTPEKDSKEYNPFKSVFEGTGKTYYEDSFTFNATVPYEFSSLDKGQDLRKWNREKLEKKVIAFYNNQWNMINKKMVDDYFSYLELREKETCQSTYDTRTDLEENWGAYLAPFTIENYKLEPLENFKMVFYDDGKIVCLQLASLDKRLRGEPALWGKYKDDDGDIIALFRRYYLYIPEGKTELEILR